MRHPRPSALPPLPPLLFLTLLLAALPAALAGQAVRGIVRDSLSGSPLSAVRVELAGAGTSRATVTDAGGGFRFAGVAPGRYRLGLTRVGYAPRRLEAVGPGPDALVVWMAALGVPLDPVVVTAIRREQAALDAPSAVTVLDRESLTRAPVLEPLNQVAQVPGVDAAQKGLVQQTFSARGGNTVNSGALLLLHDFRYAALPSVAFNLPYLVPATGDDVDRIEVIRGPAAALYGPGAPAGIVHVLTRSPLDDGGATVAVTGGSRAVLGGGFRSAIPLGAHLALRASAEYLRGRDWSSADSVEAVNRAAALAAGADPDAVLIGRRDSSLERGIADLRLDWRPAAGTDIVVSAGAAQAFRAIDLTPAVGAIQGRDWRYSYAQVRAQRHRLALNALYNWSDAGDTYVLRNGDRLVDDSRMVVTQVQHGIAVGPAELLYGADLRWTDPRTGGTIHGANEADDLVTEIGGYLYADLPLTRRLSAVAALRADHHDRLNDVVLSPRLGVVARPGATHALRLTYNRAFTSPDANDLFLDIVAQRVTLAPGVDYAVRGVGVPKDGFTFRRDCDGGLCMRSPFNLDAPGAYLPLDATRLWPALVLFAGRLGWDLSAVPPPDANDVRTTLAVLDPGAEAPVFVPLDPADVTDVAGEGRTITNVVELGYRGLVSRRVELAVDLWVNRVRDLAGPLVTATPNAFFDEESLRDYLAAYLPADSAAALADLVSRIPAGTVTPVESRYPYDVLVVSRRGGAYTLWGADLSLNVTLTPGLAASASYSWTSNDTLPDVRDVGTVYLNAPRVRGAATLWYRDPNRRWGAGIRGRWVTAFRVNSGVYDGRIPAYVVGDVSLSAGVPGWPGAELQVIGQNLVGGRHREMVGAPEVGRLVLARVRVKF